MAAPTPVVFEPVDLVPLIQYVLDRRAPFATLVICSTKEAFVQQPVAATTENRNSSASNEDESGPSDPETSTNAADSSKSVANSPWSIPTLRLLASSRTVELAFCPDVTHLRAYLSTYAHRSRKVSDHSKVNDYAAPTIPILALLNPIQLHRPTSAFSAQGLNRTLAVAVEAAHGAGCQLVLAECTKTDEDSAYEQMERAADEEAENATNAPTEVSPWEEEVSILNVTTKTFGAGERGWVGRTVKLRAIAGRWCEFRQLPAK